MTPPNVISFVHKFAEPDIDRDAKLAEYTAWLEQHGSYGRLFMWYIAKPSPGEDSEIMGVKIYDPEIAVLFSIMHGL